MEKTVESPIESSVESPAQPAPKTASPEVPPVTAAPPDKPGTIALTVEQQKRLDLLNEYEDRTREPRDARNAAIDEHDNEWRERWQALQGEIEQARTVRGEQLLKDGTPVEHHQGILAKETADLMERFETGKAAAAQKLDEHLPKLEKWVDFLKDHAKTYPDDQTITSLLEEAEKSPDAGMEGLGGMPVKAITLSDLVHSIDKDGALNYKRGLSTVIRDTGPRLDVKRMDNRDIEAALKISAQKFDMTKGLMLTGDAAFKARAAEIAGKLGLPLQNSEPEVLMAWKRGHEQNPELKQMRAPSVERGITGDLAVPRPLMELQSAVQLRADPHTIVHADPLGVVANGEGFVAMSSERLLAANATIRETPVETLRHLTHADLSKNDGALSADAIIALSKAGLINPAGDLTQVARDAVIVRDDRVIIKRDSMPEHEREMFKTSGEYVREAESLREFEARQTEQQYEAEQKSLRVRNVDEDLAKTQEQKTQEHKKEEVVQHEQQAEQAIEERRIEIAAPEIQRSSRTPSRDMDMGMGM